MTLPDTALIKIISFAQELIALYPTWLFLLSACLFLHSSAVYVWCLPPSLKAASDTLRDRCPSVDSINAETLRKQFVFSKMMTPLYRENLSELELPLWRFDLECLHIGIAYFELHKQRFIIQIHFIVCCCFERNLELSCLVVFWFYPSPLPHPVLSKQAIPTWVRAFQRLTSSSNSFFSACNIPLFSLSSALDSCRGRMSASSLRTWKNTTGD